MSFIEVLLIGIGLSADAFAVAVCKGLNMRKINYTHALIIALFFGGFQALMPLIYKMPLCGAAYRGVAGHIANGIKTY